MFPILIYIFVFYIIFSYNFVSKFSIFVFINLDEALVWGINEKNMI